MRIKRVRNLIRIVEESNISKLEISTLFGVNKILIKKRGYSAHREKQDYILIEGAVPAITVETTVKEKKVVKKEQDSVYITSPHVGTFYWHEDIENLVPKFKNGDLVKKDQDLGCIIGAGMVYLVYSPFDGVIDYVLEKPQKHPVEYGQKLFMIKPNT
jgi:biotin carboxyl carrier protein